MIVVGIVLVALPDADDRVFSVSEAHGPALVDLLGSLLVCVGWVLVLASTAGPLSRVRAVLATGTGALASGLAGLGVGLIVASVFAGFGMWWLFGAVAAAAAQLLVAGASRSGR